MSLREKKETPGMQVPRGKATKRHGRKRRQPSASGGQEPPEKPDLRTPDLGLLASGLHDINFCGLSFPAHGGQSKVTQTCALTRCAFSSTGDVFAPTYLPFGRADLKGRWQTRLTF